MSRKIKEKGGKAPIPAVSAAPRELAWHAARESAERLREQARPERTRQEPEDYGSEQVEGGVQRGAALAAHGVRCAGDHLAHNVRERLHSGGDARGRRETTEQESPRHSRDVSPEREKNPAIRERAAEPEGRMREKPVRRERDGGKPADSAKELGQHFVQRNEKRSAPQDVLQSLSRFDGKGIVEQPTQREAESRLAVWETQSLSTMRGMSCRMEPAGMAKQTEYRHKTHIPDSPNAAPLPDLWNRTAEPNTSHGRGTATGSRMLVKEKKTAARAGGKPYQSAMERGRQLAIRSARRGRLPIRAAGARRMATDGEKAAGQLKKIVKDAAASLRAMLAALTGGGGVAFLVILVICLVAMLLATPFGLFLAGGSTDSGDSLQSAITSLNGEFCMVIEQIQTDHPHDVLELDNDGLAAAMDNWNDVLAVYAVLVTTDDASPGDAATMTPEKLDVLRRVFWDMNQISYTLTTAEAPDDAITLTISITTKHQDEIAAQYGFTAEQTELLHEMAQPQYANLFAAVRGSNASLTLSPRQMREIIDDLPPNLSAERRQVVLTAYQLLGKVNYHWGGKSLAIGWDSRWGAPKIVAAAGDSTSGTMRPFGLDCSGFVDWVFYNVSNGAYVIGHGGGASAQHSYCAPISWPAAQPGDLAFYPGDSHVGVICGFDEDGNVRIIHCAKSANNVVVTGKSGFVAVGRPYYYTQ